MKKLSIFVFLVAASLLITSCEKEEESTPTPMDKATVTGFVYADLDLTETGAEYAPAGTKITLWVNTQDYALDPIPGYTYPRKYFETTVNDEGKYTVSVDVGNKPVTVNLEPGDFWYDQQINDTVTEIKKYSCIPTTVDVISGQTKIHNINFL